MKEEKREGCKRGSSANRRAVEHGEIRLEEAKEE